MIKTPALRKRALNHREYSKSYRRMVGVGENSSSKDGGVRGTSSQETGERSVWRGAFVSMWFERQVGITLFGALKARIK